MAEIPRAGRRYIAVVASCGLALCAALVGTAPWRAPVRAPMFWLMLACAVAGELVPLRVPFRGDFQRITLSTTFVFVLLLEFGIGVAVGAQVVVSLVDDVLGRKAAYKIAFNAAQYSLAVAAAGAVQYVLIGAKLGGALSPVQLFAALLAGGVFCLVNNVLTSGAIAVSHAQPLLSVLGPDLLFEGLSAIVLFTQAPLIVVVGDQRMWMLPLFVPAILAAYGATKTAVQRDHRALHDLLTELPNRDHLNARLTRELDEQHTLAIALIDIDAFGEINNTLGHDVGDALLLSVAERLRDELGADFCARVGGDEFAVLEDGSEVGDLGARVRALFATPFHIDGLPLALEASIGLATNGDEPIDAKNLLERVDVALGVARRRRSGVEVYRPAIDGRDPRRIALLSELRTAMDERQFVLHYQPVVDPATGCVEGAEALVRWEHPRRGMVMPDEFIPLVESTSLIGQFTRHVARMALQECAAWRKLGLDLTVAVNVSPRNLLEADFPEQLTALLAESGLPSSALEVEITESAAIDDVELAMSELAHLREAGIVVALDDFGTGHSSLTHLHRLPIDVVKVDKSFVFDMVTDADAASIVAMIIDLAHARGLRVVAEGVECDTAWAELVRLDCDSVQGYYVSRPLPADRFRVWLASSPYRARRRPDLPVAAARLAALDAQPGRTAIAG